MSKTATLWIIWLASTLVGGGLLLAGMFYGGQTRANLLIGETTSGHHQIELACGACHTSAFSGPEEIEKTCQGCHDADLNAAKDSHPLKKFRDPRNIARLEKLAANKCITCHTEHRPRETRKIGVTLPGDYCELCHKDVGKDRPSHVGLDFTSCASAGCHNYHDNTALYEDYLVKHADGPDVQPEPLAKQYTDDIEIPAAGPALTSIEASDAPPAHAGNADANAQWLATSHAAAGVNCSGCHVPASALKKVEEADKPQAIAANWIEKPDKNACKTCHGLETATWLQGKHGMRLAPKMLSQTEGLFGIFKDKPLSPMRPELARLPMQSKVGHVELGCTSCHAAHAFETRPAQVSGCLSCHADDHSKAYEGSPHHKLWQAETAGASAKGSGVSCATCHMPRTWIENAETYEEQLIANHNQNANLRPNEKMIRSVCLDCHGLRFSIDALADEGLVRNNFTGRPSTHIESIDWAMRRVKK